MKRTEKTNVAKRLAALALLALLMSAAGDAAEPFTVKDSIEMTRLEEPSASLQRIFGQTFNVSPDHRYVTAVTAAGNLTTELVDYALWLFRLDEVRQFVLDGTSSKMPGRVVVRFSTSSNRPAIEKVRWLTDSRTLLFLAENPDGVPQVYSFDVETERLVRQTEAPDGVLAFSATGDPRDIVFVAKYDNEAERLKRQKYGFVHTTETAMELLQPGRSAIDKAYPKGRYVVQRADKPAIAVDLPVQQLVQPKMSLSPDGRWALVAKRRLQVPDHWLQLDWGYLADMIIDAHQEGFAPAWMNQLVLVDTTTGDPITTLDAPNGFRSQIFWSEDSKRVILSDQFVPVTGALAESEWAGKHATLEIEVDSGKVTAVAEGEHMAASANATLDRVTLTTETGEKASYVKDGQVWRRVEGDSDDRAKSELGESGISLSIHSSLNEPPEIVATHAESGTSRVITDLNPQFRDLDLGTVEVFEWESGGRTWKGGLLLPRDFEEGRRYPLVVQTHGFNEWEFLMDGPDGMSAALAARPLAGRGFVVLQAPDCQRSDVVTPHEAEIVSASYIDAVKTLDERGLIDPDRVGIVGFSRTGFYVQHALVFSGFTFAAAVVADVSDFGWWMYMMGFGWGGFQGDYERMLGGLPVADGLDSWLERNPVFNIDELRTPLRIESHQIPSYWDTYVLLRRLGRPVEMVVLPEADHNPQRPWERMESQQGAVDWFAFWLMDEEEPSASKNTRYERWRRLRAEP